MYKNNPEEFIAKVIRLIKEQKATMIVEHITYNTSAIMPYSAEKNSEFYISESLCNDIVVVKLFPGIRPATLRSMLLESGARGVVLETYGAGNAPTSEWFVDLVKEAIDRGVVVVNISQCKISLI